VCRLSVAANLVANTLLGFAPDTIHANKMHSQYYIRFPDKSAEQCMPGVLGLESRDSEVVKRSHLVLADGARVNVARL
jgi:hypothetical protein